MERVTGIGGFFFRARDPDALAAWYRDRLGIDSPSWRQEEGETAFAPMGDGGEQIGPLGFGLNFRVRDLDAMVAQLKTAGETVTVDETEYPFGRFAQTSDPEGNAVQLWEPA